jgi:hypothetical protein
MSNYEEENKPLFPEYLDVPNLEDRIVQIAE